LLSRLELPGIRHLSGIANMENNKQSKRIGREK